MFLGLAVPAAVLIRQGFVQLELQEFRRQQLVAEDLVGRIDASLAAAIAVENARPFTDFQFSRAIEGSSNLVQLSPLSSPEPAGEFPGAMGYFQVDASGRLSTPLLPSAGDAGPALDAAELGARRAASGRLTDVLAANGLVRAPAGERSEAARLAFEQERAEEPNRAAIEARQEPLPSRGQAAFDDLAVANATVDERADLDAAAASGRSSVSPAELRELGVVSVADIMTFANDAETLRFSSLETDHLLLFRNAWRDGERFIQGMLIDRDVFVAEAHRGRFLGAGLAAGTRMTISVAGTELMTMDNGARGADELVDGAPLYAARLSPPLAEIELALSAGALERGAGFSLLVWTAVVLFGVLIGGFTAMYRFGLEQIRLARRQQSFVSAVSHELKTPLTSIRMYGEMLKSGWASETKKQSYYDFICDEGERLSRLIDNVLQLARLNRDGPAVALEPIVVAELFDVIRSKLATQAERAGFSLEFEIEPAVRESAVKVDCDALTQVFINLVDNGIKFSSGAKRKDIVVSARAFDRGRVVFAVRDFGPGIPPADMKRLFELFFRPDNELTRATAGTGIGLALVQQLAAAMGGRVDVRNADPGAEFRIVLPIASGRA
jgi:signal transduction histidine kinase